MTDREPLPSASGENLQDQSIEKGNATLMRQACMTAHEYLRSAVDHIDDVLGPG